MAMVTRKIRHKNGDGSIVEAEIGAKAENVLEDENHRFVTDSEKTSWNGKVDADGGDIANTKVSEFAASSTQWPVPEAGDQAKYLRADGTWQTPPNTTYAEATQSRAGLMSAADKKKVDTMPQIYFQSELPETAPVGSLCFLIG